MHTSGRAQQLYASPRQRDPKPNQKKLHGMIPEIYAFTGLRQGDIKLQKNAHMVSIMVSSPYSLNSLHIKLAHLCPTSRRADRPWKATFSTKVDALTSVAIDYGAAGMLPFDGGQQTALGKFVFLAEI